MRLEARRVRRGAVPVDGEEVEVAVDAGGHEGLEIRQAHGCASVCDCGRSQRYRALERHHVGLIGGDAVLHFHAAAAVAALIGLVKGEDRLGAVLRNTALDVGRPHRRGALGVGPKNGDEFEGGVEAGGGLAAGVRQAGPIVGPGDFGALAGERLGEVWVVVGEAAFAGDPGWAGRGA